MLVTFAGAVPSGLKWADSIAIYERVFGGTWTLPLFLRVKILERAKMETLASKQAPGPPQPGS